MGKTAYSFGVYNGSALNFLKTTASNLFGTKAGPLGMLLQGVDTCVAGQYLTSGCIMRYAVCSSDVLLQCITV